MSRVGAPVIGLSPWFARRAARLWRVAARAAARRFRPRWRLGLLAAETGLFETFAPPERLSLPPRGRLSVVAPHPDDESIGCGGLLALWAADPARSAEVVFLTMGEQGDRALRDGGLDPAAQAARRAAVGAARTAEATEALAVLGAEAVWFDGADAALWRDEARLATALGAHWRKRPPDLIAAPFPADRHADHAVAARIAAAAGLAALPSATPVLGYEVWSPCLANALLDIAPVAGRKAAAISAYRSQTATTDYVAGAAALNRFRAVSGGLGDGAAEAFHRCALSRHAEIAAALKV